MSGGEAPGVKLHSSGRFVPPAPSLRMHPLRKRLRHSGRHRFVYTLYEDVSLYLIMKSRSPGVIISLCRGLISSPARPLQQLTLAFITTANPKSPPSLMTRQETNRVIVTVGL